MHPFRIGSAGDVLTHANVLNLARRHSPTSEPDFTPFFARLAPVLRAHTDLALYQQETPLTNDPRHITTGDQDDGHYFNAPHQLARALAGAGFAGCSTANNHTWDAGVAGAAATRAILDRYDLGAAGPHPDCPDEHGVIYHCGEYTVAHFAYSYTLHNAPLTEPPTTPTGHPWAATNLWPLRGPEGIIADAQAARADGCDVVIVSMHWGIEYEREDGLMRDWAREILSSGAVDWIAGNHPHVHQGVENINGRYVTYSQGNLLGGRDASVFNGWPQDTSLAVLNLNRDESGTITRTLTLYPLMVDQLTRQVIPATLSSQPQTWWHIHRLANAYGGEGIRVAAEF